MQKFIWDKILFLSLVNYWTLKSSSQLTLAAFSPHSKCREIPRHRSNTAGDSGKGTPNTMDHLRRGAPSHFWNRFKAPFWMPSQTSVCLLSSERIPFLKGQRGGNLFCMQPSKTFQSHKVQVLGSTTGFASLCRGIKGKKRCLKSQTCHTFNSILKVKNPLFFS